MGTCEGRVGCCVWFALYAPKMAAIEMYTPQGAEIVSGIIYVPNAPWAPEFGGYVPYISPIIKFEMDPD